jgi:RNA polymerase sigma factor (sigma-70 family)
MSPEGEVTRCLNQLKKGDAVAAQELWQRYFERLVKLARDKLRGAARRMADEEDVALSAFKSFCCAVDRGRFPRLDDRHDLWQVLAMITVRKAADLANREARQKRGGGAVIQSDDFGEVISGDPDPAQAAELAENCQRLLDALGEGKLRAVAVAKMEGRTNEEIAELLDTSVPSVERKLRGCREILEKWLAE